MNLLVGPTENCALTRSALRSHPADINDGFGGGHTVASNLCFNAVRETSDHGCFNSWDREPYFITPGSPPHLYPATTHISSNFFINNYHSTWPIDHDDGSNNFVDSLNFLPWGGAKNYLGFDKHFIGNFYLYPDASMPTSGLASRTGFSPYCYGSAGEAAFGPGLRDSWVNETCVAGTMGAVYQLSCDSSAPQNGYVPVLANNTFYLDAGSYSFTACGATWDLPTAQAHGFDVGTTVLATPNTAGILALAQAFVAANLMARPL